jgi:transposase
MGIMDAREMKGLEIAARARIEKRGESWVVPSQSNKGTYRVTIANDGPHCTCPDFELRGVRCKHGYAVEIVMQRETVTETMPSGESRTTVTETAAVRVTYPQNWPAYNRAQTQEKSHFCRLMRELAGIVPEPVQVRGRPRIPVAEGIFSAAYKVYTGASSRRFMTDLREAHADGFVSRPWHFNSVLGVIEDATLTPVLTQLVTASAAPLASVESTFAVDSTGFGTQQYYRHFTAKYGKEMVQHDWLKLHALVGTKTNIIAAATVTDRNANDSPHFAPLVETGASVFNYVDITADKAYGSRKNVALTAALGANPYIALRAHSKQVSTRMYNQPKNSPDSMAWRWLYHLYNLHRDEFLTRYHARSNAESTFSSMKRVFGDTLRSKTREAQNNELYLKVIVHNVVCLIHSMFDLDLTLPPFTYR